MQLGVIEPIIVRPAADGRYQVVAGERRVKAAYMAEKLKIPAVVRQLSDQQAMEMTIVENLQREDLDILDQARAYLAAVAGVRADPGRHRHAHRQGPLLGGQLPAPAEAAG